MPKRLLTTLAALVLTLSATAATAAPFSFNVTVDTAPLTTFAGGPLWLDFLLIDGGPGSGSNTVSISGLDFGSGSALGTAQTFGGATGDLATGVELTDIDFVNDFYQQFVPGGFVSFLVTTTANFEGGTPDQFSFSILAGVPPLNIATTDPLFTNTLLTLDINALVLGLGNLQAFESTDPLGISVTTAEVPEPATLLLVGAGLAGAVARARRRRSNDTRPHTSTL